MRSVKVVAVALLLPMFATILWSQTGTSSVRGTVTDPQGRVIPDATLTLTSAANNSARTVKSGDGGTFTFDFLTPGEYRLDAEAAGFKKRVVNNVRALVGKQTEADVQLEVGTVGEVVEVRAANENLVNTQDATLGNNFVSQQITQLPLEGRNLIDLLSLQPGTTREGYVTGARADQSNVTLDGVDINNAQTANVAIPDTNNSLVIGSLDTDRGNITSGPVLRLNSEAIEEFRVTTANPNANQGRSSGSQVNLVTKAGTNNWHGAGFEFYRSRGFTANDWFNNHALPPFGPVDRPPLVRNTFGGALGGPIVKNRAFFFYSYEGRRDAAAQAVTRVVPLPTLGQGIINYRYCTDASCDTIQQGSLTKLQNQQAYNIAGINQIALDALTDAAAHFPANDASQGDGLNTLGYRFNAPTPIKLNSNIAKLDFNLTNNQTVFMRGNVIRDRQTLPQWLPGSPSPSVWNHPWGLAAGHTWTIGNHWVNNLRYGYTRQAFTQAGDSNGNDIHFRFVFQPTSEQHTLHRITPVHNITDDVSWIHGNHNIQFGTNIRLINNQRISFQNAFDFGITNPSFYGGGAGRTESGEFQDYLDANNLPGHSVPDPSDPTSTIPLMTSISSVQNAATAIIGRLSEYIADYTYGKDQQITPVGTPTTRNFATQAYDTYVQDSWKVNPNLTLTMGLRYSLERPVYEKNGFQVQPIVPLGTYFGERLAAARNGQNFVNPIVLQLSGPANGGPPLYDWDKNNFQPRIALAWSPDGGKSVLRGGFALTNDYYGQALAVDFDLNTTLGFSSNFTTPFGTFRTDRASRLGPLFTGYGMDIRSLDTVPPFSLQQPSDLGLRIEQSVDSNLHAPTQYVWNATFERQLPKGMVFSASYIGRKGTSLLARRDAVAFNDLRDPITGMDWYAAGTELEKLRQAGTDISQIPALLSSRANAYFNNAFPANLTGIVENFENFGNPCCFFDPTWTNAQVFYSYQTPQIDFFSGNDWTDTQAEVDFALADAGLPTKFVQPQYGALSAWSTVGNSSYNAFTVSLRQRLNSLTLDFNYTFSHSLDDASGLQTETGFGNNSSNGAFIVNPIRQHDNYASSDFDVRHNINADAVWQFPFGKGRSFLSNPGKVAEAIVGGWQLSGIFRWNTGLPVQPSPFDDTRWATNWNVQANVTPTHPIHTCPNRPASGSPKLFGGSGCDVTEVYQSFRNAYPGETGSRNWLRMPGYIDLDLGLAKTWTMPWSEGHQLQLRWDVFNVTNTQHFGAIDGSRTGFGIGLDPARTNLRPEDNWSNFTQIQGQPRVMQIGARYSF